MNQCLGQVLGYDISLFKGKLRENIFESIIAKVYLDDESKYCASKYSPRLELIIAGKELTRWSPFALLFP